MKRRDGADSLLDVSQGWTKDYQRFLRGAYSKMSAYAKDKIRENSGLKYEVADVKGNKITDAILMALDKHPVLKARWLDICGQMPTLSDELLSAPRPESFITLG